MEMSNKELAKTLVLERFTLEAKLRNLHESLAGATHRADIDMYIGEVTRAQLLALIRECAHYIEEALETLHLDTEEYVDLLTYIEGLHYKGKLYYMKE